MGNLTDSRTRRPRTQNSALARKLKNFLRRLHRAVVNTFQHPKIQPTSKKRRKCCKSKSKRNSLASYREPSIPESSPAVKRTTHPHGHCSKHNNPTAPGRKLTPTVKERPTHHLADRRNHPPKRSGLSFIRDDPSFVSPARSPPSSRSGHRHHQPHHRTNTTANRTLHDKGKKKEYTTSVIRYLDEVDDAFGMLQDKNHARSSRNDHYFDYDDSDDVDDDVDDDFCDDGALSFVSTNINGLYDYSVIAGSVSVLVPEAPERDGAL
jgi:hypothetical protein